MGAWNTSILGNDTAADVAAYFKRMYKYQEGGDYKWSAEQISDSLYTYYYDTMHDLPSEKCNVLFTLALSLWQINALTPQLKQQVQQLVYNKTDYNAWKELDASEKTLQERWKATTEFCKKLDTVCDKAAIRNIPPKKLSLYKCGDCLAFNYQNYYYGITVVNDGRNHDDGSNELMFVDIKSKTKPSLEDFRKSSPLLNEDLVNFFKGSPLTLTEISNTVYVFKMQKAAIKSLQKLVMLVGNLPFTRTFFESSGIQFSERETAYKSAVTLVTDALAFWKQHPWHKSKYQLQYECAAPFKKNMLQNGILHFRGMKFKTDDIEIKIYNSLWHINVMFRVKSAAFADIEKCWTDFAGFFEYLTGREVNKLSIADQTTDLQSLKETDLSIFKMKHVSTGTII